MALFRRKKQTTIAELEDYYANQRGKRTGMAWFMAFLSLLITIAVILALFFGGRWIYRTIFSNDDTSEPTTTATGVDTGVELPTFDGSLPNSPNEDAAASGDSAIGQTEPEGVVSDEAAVTSQPNTATTPTANDSASVAGAQTTDLPNTGAGESILAVLLSTAVFGYLLNRRKQLRG